MSVRNLDAIFRPKSVALIGASTRPHAIGALVARNLLGSAFEGRLMLVNPHATEIAGQQVYPDLKSLPAAPDLAVICTPPGTIPALISELGKLGARGVVIISAGFGEVGSEEGKALEREMLAAAKPTLLRIVGPNCIGVLSPPSHLNASFAHVPPKQGRVAFVAQSGAMLTTVLDWATARDIGFSHLVSLGDMADVDFGDVLDYLATDDETDSVLLYIEAVTHARKFMSAARAAARLKPVIAIKAGRSPAAAHAASSHTGALAGIDGVYDAAFRRAGILRVNDLDELFDALETLATRPRVHSESLIILTNGGGVGVLATDALVARGGKLTQLNTKTLEQLDSVLPPSWSHGNPVDIIGDADAARYASALEILMSEPARDAILVLNCPTAVASGSEAAQAVIASAKEDKRAIFTSWLGQAAAESARRSFGAAGVPTYETPEKAVRGFMHALRYARGQELLMEVPASIQETVDPDRMRARTIVQQALDAGEQWLSPSRLWPLMDCYGIPTPRTVVAGTDEEVAEIARRFTVPIALKIISPDVVHKSELGGVILDIVGHEAAKAAAQAMQARIHQSLPGARIEGFLVQEMVQRSNAFELILGMSSDAIFGPFLLFGHGGTAVEVINDKALALPPLNVPLARELMSQTRIWRELQGYRDHAPAALDAIAAILVRLSQLVCDFAEIVEVDINPLLADSQRVIALDARVRVKPGGDTEARLAIKPYPKDLERRESLAGFDNLLLRPIKPEDATALADLFAKLTPEDVRLRFFSVLSALPKALRLRLTQIDYDREMAFVLLQGAEIIGVARIAADPDNERAEFAVVVRSDLKGRGLGRLLMDRIVEYARCRGIGELFGHVLPENTIMLSLCRDLGCALSQDASGAVQARLPLRTVPTPG